MLVQRGYSFFPKTINRPRARSSLRSSSLASPGARLEARAFGGDPSVEGGGTSPRSRVRDVRGAHSRLARSPMLARRPRPGRRRARLARASPSPPSRSPRSAALALAPSGHRPPRRGLRQDRARARRGARVDRARAGHLRPRPHVLASQSLRQGGPAGAAEGRRPRPRRRARRVRARGLPADADAGGDGGRAAPRLDRAAGVDRGVVETFARTYAAAFPTQQK